MTNWRDYSAATRAALAAISRGTCYYPGCRTPILVFLGGQPEVNVEIALVRGAKPHEPRYVPGMSDEATRSFDNLLLLCVPHRKTIDRDEQAYPIALLDTWRPRPDAGDNGALADLRDLTEARLDDLLKTAFSVVQEEVAEALSRFAQSDPESAQLVRQLVGTPNDHQGRYRADHEMAGILGQVARQLNSLEDTAARLLKAAGQPGGAADNATALDASLRRLADLVSRLESASKRANAGWPNDARGR